MNKKIIKKKNSNYNKNLFIFFNFYYKKKFIHLIFIKKFFQRINLFFKCNYTLIKTPLKVLCVKIEFIFFKNIIVFIKIYKKSKFIFIKIYMKIKREKY
jgi:hypothetical protein